MFLAWLARFPSKHPYSRSAVPSDLSLFPWLFLEPSTLFLRAAAMAYNQYNGDQYHQPVDNYYSAPNTGVAPDYPAQTPHTTYEQPQTTYAQPRPDYDSRSMKSYNSGYASSQAHLNPQSQYEMSQVSLQNAPPVPMMPYAFQPNYPPQQQRPGFKRDPSSAGYSMAREKMMKRRSMKQVELVNGNLVLDVQVPSHITSNGAGGPEEMSKMRYTAATCDPDQFMRAKYTLRPYLYGRHTELFIVLTMYNEDEILFCKTMNA
ncbi:hypothetical protein HWV62_42368, partial [Athelia sp. TMB]